MIPRGNMQMTVSAAHMLVTVADLDSVRGQGGFAVDWNI